MKSPPQKYIFPSMRKFHCSDLKLKLNKLSPKESQNIHLISKQILFKRKKKFENRTQESRPENSLINHHENCDRTISMSSRFPFPRSHTAPSKEQQSTDFRNRDCFLPFPSPSILPRLKEVPVEEEKTGRKKFRLETIE